MYDQITASLFRQMVLHGAACIAREKQAVNDLNVFPVPDGDTGTNMSLTMSAAAAALRGRTPSAVGDAADTAASALLRGARGNSGVILSLLFRGLAKSLRGKAECSAADWARAMCDGVDAAYKAVMKPAEGTVLTVSRCASEAAAERIKAGVTDIEELLADALAVARETLAKTVDMNPVLRKAGVVDAGGQGGLPGGAVPVDPHQDPALPCQKPGDPVFDPIQCVLHTLPPKCSAPTHGADFSKCLSAE